MRTLSLSISLLLASPIASFSASITAFHSPVVYDFESFTGTGFSPTPVAGQLESDDWIVTGLSEGSLAYGGTETTGDFARGASNGGVGTGGVYAFNTASNTALGVQAGGSDFTPGTFELRLQNDTGAVINSLAVSYDIWLLNDQGRANSFNFSYATNSTGATPPAATSPSGFDFTSPEAADVSPAWTSTSRGTTLTGLGIADGDYFFARWTGNDVSGAGSRDEFGLDNVSITAVPEPATMFSVLLTSLLLGAGIFGRRR